MIYNMAFDDEEETKLTVRYYTCLAKIINATHHNEVAVKECTMSIVRQLLLGFEPPGGEA